LTQAASQSKAGDSQQARKLAEQARTILVKLAGQLTAAQAKLEGGTNE